MAKEAEKRKANQLHSDFIDQTLLRDPEPDEEAMYQKYRS